MAEDLSQLSQIREDLAVMKQHILILNNEGGEMRDELKAMNKLLGEIRIDLASQKADQEWIKKLSWVVISVSVGVLVTSILNLLLQNK